ncbi:hypothetical protein IR148_00455 [Dysgonomonas mossii]|uniref:Uncharacterized protein n=1 Tax=Dysgonomonas mossii TaxID=163665 RepID=A0A4Y9IPP9_9BACT|nr:hypothetical protein [Dysgonomonas mossii]MBF0759512.1 hypothetical protein [Dysgonomonas mossii]TFU90483.1 hypothetical protein E4T88_00460 [Dysgonomonas mossii]
MKQGIELNNKDYKVIARHIMQAIQLDNGYGHVEGISYPDKWVSKLSKSLQIFFEANPDKFTDEDVENISLGGYDENLEIYGDLIGWSELDKVLNDYFDEGMGVGIVEEKPRIMHTYHRVKK